MAEDRSLGRQFKLVVGLGNPGRQYDNTRHNVGFCVVDLLARQESCTWSSGKKWEADIARGTDRIYLKPRTYMNLSGAAVGGISRFFKIRPDEILVIHDDADLPLGALRFRVGGSPGGHRGVESIIQSLGTGDFARLKIGVGRRAGEAAGGKDLAAHVLGKFLVDEQPIVEKTLDLAVEAVNDAASRGLEAAMTVTNRRPEKRRRGKRRSGVGEDSAPDPGLVSETRDRQESEPRTEE